MKYEYKKEYKNIKYRLTKNSIKKNRKRNLNNMNITLKENYFNVKYYIYEMLSKYYYTNHYYINNKQDLYLYDKEIFHIKNTNDILRKY